MSNEWNSYYIIAYAWVNVKLKVDTLFVFVSPEMHVIYIHPQSQYNNKKSTAWKLQINSWLLLTILVYEFHNNKQQKFISL